MPPKKKPTTKTKTNGAKPKPTKKHANGAAHAKPSKPAQEPTEAQTTAKAGSNGAADHPAPDAGEGTSVARVADAILVELRKDPDISWLEESLIEKICREQDVDEETVRDALADLEHENKVLLTVGPNDPGSVRLWVEDDGEDEGEDDEPEPEPEVVSQTHDYSYKPTRNLEHVFTEAEVHEMRLAVEEHHEEADRLQKLIDQKSEELKSLKKRYDLAIEDALATSRRIRAGSEWQDVECEERREIDQRADEPTHGKVMMVTYRLDTNEPIEWRELNFQERQGKLFDPAAPTPANTEMRGAL